jgi:large subunit ribosomal protein L17
MKHKIGFNRLDRSAAHRKALHRNMVGSLLRYERVTTTKAKALEIRKSAEKMITRAKEDSVHNRRMVSRRLFDEGILAKLFTDIAPRMKDRAGGYTRIIKLGARAGDAAEMVILELVDYKLVEPKAKPDKKAASAKADDKTTGKPEKAEKKAVKTEKKSENKPETKKAEPKKAKAPAAEPKKTGTTAPAKKASTKKAVEGESK